MPIVTLNNGKTVEIPFEQWDAMDDQQWRIFMDSEYGEEINDPFYGSQLNESIPRKFITDDDDIIDYD